MEGLLCPDYQFGLHLCVVRRSLRLLSGEPPGSDPRTARTLHTGEGSAASVKSVGEEFPSSGCY